MTSKTIMLGGASALAIGILMTPTFAQGTDQVETVVVTGLRASLQSAQAIKQNSDQVVDSITATDIGALPDRNVAEALQRVPGITLQRNDAANDLSRMGSTGNSVYVRGLSWVKTLVNGRDEFTAVNGRSLSFADISADLMSGVDVYKSPTAKMIEGGVGGLVDLKTRKPFDSDGQKIALSGDLTYGDLSDRARPSVNALYSNRWATPIGEVGALLSVDWQDQFTRTEGVNLYAFRCWDSSYTSYNSLSNGYNSCMENDLGSGRVMAPDGMYVRQMEFHQRRLATNLVLQWRPADSLEVTLSALNSYAQTADMEHAAAFSLSSDQAKNATYDSSYNWIGGTASLGSFTTRGGTGHNRNSDISLNVKYNPTDALEISVDAQFVESSSPYRNVTFATSALASPTFTFDIAGNKPKFSYDGGSDTTDASQYTWLSAMDYMRYNVAHSHNVRTDATYTFQEGGLFGVIKSVDAGFRTEQKLAVSRTADYNWGATCPKSWGGDWSGCPTLDGTTSGGYTALDGSTVEASTASSQSSAVAGITKYAQLYSFEKIFGNSIPSAWMASSALAAMDTVQSWKLFSAIEPQAAEDHNGVQTWASWYSLAAIAGCSGTSDVYCLAAYKNLTGSGSANNRINSQNEQTYAGYMQVNYGYDTFLGFDVPVDGNIGFRVVRTQDQISAGKLVMPSLGKTYCTIGEYMTSATVGESGYVTSCADWQTAYDFLGGLSGQGATVDRPGVKNNYTNILPSFNFRAHLSDTLQARFSYSEQIVRPEFSQTNSSATLSFDFYNSDSYRYGTFENSPYGTGGNPYLKPMHATNYDASLEWYFSPSGSLTLSLFHKDLSNYIHAATTTMTFTHPLTGESLDFNYTTYVNGNKGKVEGFELAYQQFFDQLPGFWSGFGVQANYTKIYNSGGSNTAATLRYSQTVLNSQSSSLPLEGMSNDSYNLALMYAKYDIDARLAWNWRSSYLSSSADSNSPYEPVWMENYGQLDASVFYSFWDHYKAGIQATNLTGSIYHTDMGYADYHPRVNWIQADRKFSFIVRANW